MPLGVDCFGWASAKHTFGVPEAAKADHSLYFSRSVGLSAQADVQLRAVMIEAARTAETIRSLTSGGLIQRACISSTVPAQFGKNLR